MSAIPVPAEHPASEAPAPPWRLQLQEQLQRLPAARRRHLRPFLPAEGARLQPASAVAEEPPLLDLASNDYLGLSRDPALLAAARAELDRSGLGAGASRLISGTRPIHLELESELATWLGRERVLLFPSGFQANLAAVAALADRHTLVLADRLVHHSLLAGVRCSGARLQRFRHNDSADLGRRLLEVRQHDRQQRVLVLCESLYSMEGTSPDLAALAGLCAEHGALLLVDEAHALGVLGPGGRGLSRTLPAELRSHTLLSGTFGKAFGSGGAFLAGDVLLGDWLLQQSGAFRYSTGLAPALAAGALAALERLQRLEAEGAAAGPPLLERARRWREGLVAAGWPRPPGEGPVLPLVVGDDAAALDLQQRLEAEGLLTVAIRPPTVPQGTARLRLVLRQDLPAGTLKRLLAALGPAPPGTGAPSSLDPPPRAAASPGAAAPESRPAISATCGAEQGLQVIAMHGWSGQARHWDPWRAAFATRGWSWQSGERGYGEAAAISPQWQASGRRVVIAHSLGPHLLTRDLLATAEAVVLLASFGRFVPPGPAGRRLRRALEGMGQQLEGPDEARTMLRSFLQEAAAPEPAEQLPRGPADGPLGEEQRQRLRQDLELLGATRGLPDGFPAAIPVLVVEAGQDRIVVPEARQLLRRDLERQRNRVQWLTLEDAGHCLLQPGLVAQVMAWLQQLESR